ncbi:MAG: HTH-type transcriptional regulator CysB [Gammaproteobacteria bacterium]|mgnify:FL=1|jgi:LysR family cys regulon transcriptional activator|tara:strand:+ start:1052 stop:2026 length:975 start_codon:yes stop_codon:yes gene_type:complete
MKLHQLRYIWEVAKQGLNVSQAAAHLYSSQPGISKQIRLLEEELGLQIFTRRGKHLVEITPAGLEILETSGEILQQIEKIQSLAQEHSDAHRGSLSLATTHTQYRYVLPPIIRRFIDKYPDVALHMHQGTPTQISAAAVNAEADFAIATEALELYTDLHMLPCYRWNRSILVPKGHPLLEESNISLYKIASYPIITYTFGFTGRSKLDEAFDAQGLKPRVVLTAADADVIKTYVRLGLGIGIVASMAFDAEIDKDLVVLDASGLFEPSTTKIGFRRNSYFRGYMYDFIEMFAPHLNRDLVRRSLKAKSMAEVDELVGDIELPVL